MELMFQKRDPFCGRTCGRGVLPDVWNFDKKLLKYGSEDKRLSCKAHTLRGVGSTPTTAPNLYILKNAYYQLSANHYSQ